MTVSREAAWTLLTEWTQSDSLRKHALAVEAAVRGYAGSKGKAKRSGGWSRCCTTSITSAIRHLAIIRTRAASTCATLGYPEWVMRAIQAHAWEMTGVQPETPLERALVACDEMAGFVTAAALVRPSKSILDLEASSVKKRMKDKAFARAVPREHLHKGAELMGLPLEHAHRQRDSVHASGGRGSGSEGLAVTEGLAET